MHLNPAFPGIKESIVLKPLELKIAIEFPIDSLEQIEVESSGYALFIIIGTVKHSRVFLQVYADK
jgi:hypothetical protein